jgi:hypothetical protein
MKLIQYLISREKENIQLSKMNGNGNNLNNLNMNNNQVQDYINNNRINLNAPGNQGRYTCSTHFQTLEEWDSIFSHLSVYSAGVHATADFLQGMQLRRPNDHRRNYAYDSFPLIAWIPLPCSIPHFSRCILHVEEVNPRTNTLSGSSFIPVEITHHDNHPITSAIARMFREDRHPHRHQYPPSYQTNESLVFETARENEAIRQMCACLTRTQGGNNFAEYDAQQDANRNEQHADLNTASRHILYDPETLARANARVNELMLAQQGRGVHEMTIQESQQVHRAWREVVFPETTAEERRYAYARYAADQIMMHRYVHDNNENNNPYEPNPIALPFDDDDHRENNRHHRHHHRENNPVDRARQEQAPENVYIQELYNGQNNDERARIAAQDVAVHPVHPPL